MSLQEIDARQLSDQELLDIFRPTRDKILNQAEEGARVLSERVHFLVARIRQPLSQIAHFTLGL